MDYIELDIKFEELNPWQDIATALLAEINFESFENTDLGLKAYISKDDFTGLDSIKTYLSENLNVPYTIEENLHKDQNWNATWEANFEPIFIQNKLEIIAPFHESKKLEFSIIINPQMSFGTGHHETTRLISTYLLEFDLNGKKVLDMGTGTGVLAILAEKKGAKNILGVDIEDWAFNNAKENISLNKCSQIDIRKGDIDCVHEENFDILIANINKNVLLKHLPSYSNKLKSAGDLFLSGFFRSDKQDLVTKAEECGFKFVKELNENDWSALHLKKI